MTENNTGLLGYALAVRLKDDETDEWQLGESRKSKTLLLTDLRGDLNDGLVTRGDLKPFDLKIVAVYEEDDFLV